MESDISFGLWVEKRRKAFDLTRAELAQKTGCSPSTLRKIESDERRPSKQLAELLASALDIPTDERPTFVRIARGEHSIERLKTSALISTSNLFQHPQTFSKPIPIPPTPLVGRETELAALRQMLTDPQCRLITLVGPGGSGKTRLAIEIVSQLENDFDDGAYFVPLAPVNSSRFVVPVIADSIGFSFQGASPTDPKTQLINYLRGKHILLLVDNLEHLLNESDVTELLTDLIQQAPCIKLLTTSRESLNLQGEWVFDVHGLPVPESEETEGTSVELFVQRASRAYVRFTVTTDDYPAILKICTLVDGMPLGIELAAAWVRTLSCMEIAKEIERGLDFLSTSIRDVPERHRSIQAVFDHSWKLLSDEEQTTLSRLAVFQGKFSRAAAEQVAGATLSTLSSLVTKSLIRRSGDGRYDLHELLRQYVKSQAQADLADFEKTKGCHSGYYLQLARSLEQRLIGPEQVSARTEFVSNLENIRPAWDYAVKHDQVEIMMGAINSFWNFFEAHTWFHEGMATFGIAADEIGRACGGVDHMDTAHLILYEYLRCCLGWCYLHVGKFQEARNVLEEGIEALRSHGALAELSRSLHYWGVIHWQAGEYVKALEIFHEKRLLDLQRENTWDLGMAYGNLGMVTETMGLLEESRTHFQKAISISRSLGDLRLLGIGLFYFGSVKNKLGLTQEGKTHLYESLEISRSLGDRFGISMACNSLGMILQKENNLVEAQQMFQESLNVSLDMGEQWLVQQSLVHLGFSKFALREVTEAQDCFLRSLRMALDADLTPCILDSLAGIAWVHAEKGKEEDALKLAIVIENHQAATQEAKEHAVQLRAKLQEQLTTAQIEAIHSQVENVTLKMIVEDSLR